MAFRIEKAAVRGELSNEERGVVTGRIWLAGHREPLLLRLRGDCLRDLAGGTVRFTNPRPEADAALAVLAPEQNGVAGELTASRKIRQPAVSDQDVLELLEKGHAIPCRIANCLYLEWYSEENGRVVLEATDYAVAVSVPVWSMTAEENANQLAASQQHFQRFLHAITGDDPEAIDANENDGGDDERDEAGLGAELGESALAGLEAEDLAAGTGPEDDDDVFELVDGEPLNEFEWEQELREADRRAEAYQEALEKYRDHPEREKMIAAALGWDDEPDDEEAEADASLREALLDGSVEVFDGAGPTPAWAEGAGDGAEPGDEDPFGSHHPLSQRAMDFALALQREAEERGLMGDSPDARDHSPVLSLIMHIITLGGKLAGALDGWAQGHDPDPGFIIAMLKRAQVPLNEALHAFDCIDAASLNAETRQWLQSRKRDLFDLRRDIIDLMHQLRTS